jgi:hypothetical protein
MDAMQDVHAPDIGDFDEIPVIELLRLMAWRLRSSCVI